MWRGKQNGHEIRGNRRGADPPGGRMGCAAAAAPVRAVFSFHLNAPLAKYKPKGATGYDYRVALPTLVVRAVVGRVHGSGWP